MFFLSPFLRLFFRLLYHQFAWTYDWVAGIVSVGLWKDWVVAVLPYLAGPSVLELGHGPGHLQGAMLEKEIRAIGVDASRQMGRLARRRLRRRGLPHRLVQAKAQSLPLASGSIDQVVSTFPTEYINDADTLGETWRVLRPGGRLVILPAAWITGQRWMERYAAGLFRITRQVTPLPVHRPVNDFDGRDPGRGAGDGGNLPAGSQVEFPLVHLLEKTGFQVKVDWLELRSSNLIVIQGEKIAA